MVKNYFSDKVVLITGGSSGLGKTFVDYFMKKKATVIVFSRKNKFKKKMYSKKNKFFFYKFDLNHLSKIKLLIKDIIIKFKRIDVLINNAGVVSDWPGLKSRNLHDGRDLMATIDMRSVCSACLEASFGLEHEQIAEHVFGDHKVIRIYNEIFS